MPKDPNDSDIPDDSEEPQHERPANARLSQSEIEEQERLNKRMVAARKREKLAAIDRKRGEEQGRKKYRFVIWAVVVFGIAGTAISGMELMRPAPPRLAIVPGDAAAKPGSQEAPVYLPGPLIEHLDKIVGRTPAAAPNESHLLDEAGEARFNPSVDELKQIYPGSESDISEIRYTSAQDIVDFSRALTSEQLIRIKARSADARRLRDVETVQFHLAPRKKSGQPQGSSLLSLRSQFGAVAQNLLQFKSILSSLDELSAQFEQQPSSEEVLGEIAKTSTALTAALAGNGQSGMSLDSLARTSLFLAQSKVAAGLVNLSQIENKLQRDLDLAEAADPGWVPSDRTLLTLPPEALEALRSSLQGKVSGYDSQLGPVSQAVAIAAMKPAGGL